jgi:hypothetical protein
MTFFLILLPLASMLILAYMVITAPEARDI